jgi:hypothetical protein
MAMMKSICRFSTKFAKVICVLSLALVLMPVCHAQNQSQQTTAGDAGESGTSTDLFVMLGSDFVRPGLAAKANYNIGIGHTFGFLKKDPIGD